MDPFLRPPSALGRNSNSGLGSIPDLTTFGSSGNCRIRDVSATRRPAKASAVDRGPKHHLNIRIPQTMVSGFPPYIGPWNQNVRSLLFCGLLEP